jgi:hypothetical protein
MIRRITHSFSKVLMPVSLAVFRIGLAVSFSLRSLAQTSGTWTATRSMSTARIDHTSTLLTNGQVLVAGVAASSYYTSGEVYTPSSGKWSLTGSMNTARASHTATLLQNGQALVAGGNNTSNFGQTSAELYDPSTGKWMVTGSMNTARIYQTATLLNTGKVLVTGGQNSQANLSSAGLYDPSAGTWTKTGKMSTTRVGHTATLLQNGQVADIAPPCFCTPTNVAVACAQMSRRTRPREASSLAVIIRELEPIFITMGWPLTAHRNTTLGQSCG